MPPLIGPYGCENVLIEGVTLLRSPFWQMHPLLCKNVIIRSVTAVGNPQIRCARNDSVVSIE